MRVYYGSLMTRRSALTDVMDRRRQLRLHLYVFCANVRKHLVKTHLQDGFCGEINEDAAISRQLCRYCRYFSVISVSSASVKTPSLVMTISPAGLRMILKGSSPRRLPTRLENAIAPLSSGSTG